MIFVIEVVYREDGVEHHIVVEKATSLSDDNYFRLDEILR